MSADMEPINITASECDGDNNGIIKRPVGRPVGSLKGDRATPPTPKKEIINGQTYYFSFVKHKTKDGKTRYYKIKKAYTPATERKRRAVYGNPNYTQKKKAKIHGIKKSITDNMNKLTLDELDTLARIFTECDITAVKNNIIRLHKEDLSPAITAH